MKTPVSPATLLKKKTLAKVFSYEFYKICKNNFSHRAPLVVAFENLRTQREIKKDIHLC